MAKQTYDITDQAGDWIAGYRRAPDQATIDLTPTEAAYEVALGTIRVRGVVAPDAAAVEETKRKR